MAVDPIAHYRKCRGLAQELVANRVVDARLTVDDLCCLSLARLQELKANATKAAPVLPGAGGGGADPYASYPDNPGFEAKQGKAAEEFAGYDINEHLGAAK